MRRKQLNVRGFMFAAFIFLAMSFWSARVFAKDKIFIPETPAHHILPNGLEIYFIPNTELPVVDMMMYLKGGSVYDPKGKEGLAQLSIQSLRLGGTEKESPENIEEALEQVSATLEMGVQSEYATATLSLLKKDFSLGLKILMLLLRSPTFQKDRFDLVKSHVLESLEREKEDPFSYANKEFYRMIYQNDSDKPEKAKNAWGRFPTVTSVKKIERDDVIAYFKKNVCPDRMVFAVSGQMDESELVAKLQKATEGWSRCATVLAPLDPVRPAESVVSGEKPRDKKLTRPELTQSSILLGHLGTHRFNPDKYALQVMNFLLGGGGALNSRMGEEIRSNAGKAYVVYSDFGFGKDRGAFRLIAQTAIANTDWVVQKIKEMVAQLQEGGAGKATAEEVDRAKKGILRSLMFDFETPFAQVKEQARFAVLGYPENYIQDFQKKIEAVSVSDVNRVAQKYLKPDQLSTLVFTNANKSR